MGVRQPPKPPRLTLTNPNVCIFLVIKEYRNDLMPYRILHNFSSKFHDVSASVEGNVVRCGWSAKNIYIYIRKRNFKGSK
jgi:hypothetical protein